MLRVDVEFGYHGYRKKWTSIFGISFQVCDGLWLGPKSDGKASSNRQHGWAWIRGAEPDYWVWMAGHHLQNGYGPSKFIKILSNNQIGWECFNRTRFRLLKINEHYWTEFYRVEPHDLVSDPVFFAEAGCRKVVEHGGANHWDSFRFTFTYSHQAVDILVGHPQPFPILRVSLVLAPRIPSIRNLDTGDHGFVGALAMPLNLQNIQVEV